MRMETIDIVFYTLLEKESEHFDLFFNSSTHKDYNVINMELTVLFNQGIKISIVLEKHNLFQYKVAVFYERAGFISKNYEVQRFNFKYFAHKYVDELKMMFQNESIKNILLNYILLLNSY